MNFGLDWDGTCEMDLDLWRMFVMLAQRAEHKVYIVTMRYPSERMKEGSEITDEWVDLVDGVIFTSRNGKKPFCLALGLHIDVWIDDNPLAVEYHAREVFGVATPEGLVVAKTEDLPKEYRQTAIQNKSAKVVHVKYIVPQGFENDIRPKDGSAWSLDEITQLDFVEPFTKMRGFSKFSVHTAPMGNFLIAEVSHRGVSHSRVVAEIRNADASELRNHFGVWLADTGEMAA